MSRVKCQVSIVNGPDAVDNFLTEFYFFIFWVACLL